MAKWICQRVREIRKAAKLTQAQFAELIDISEDSIGKIERGVSIPTIETLDKIARGLRIPLKDLVDCESKKPLNRLDKTINDFNMYLKTKDPEDVQFLHELAIMVLDRDKRHSKKKEKN